MININSAVASNTNSYLAKGGYPANVIKTRAGNKTSTIVRALDSDQLALSDLSLPTVMPLSNDNQPTLRPDLLLRKILGEKAGDYSEEALVDAINLVILVAATKLLLPSTEVSETTKAASPTYSLISNYSVANIFLKLILVSSKMSETNQDLLDMQKDMSEINTGLLEALNAEGEAQTKELDKIHDHIQHLLDKIRKLGIFGKLAVGLVSLVSELAGCAAAVATGNVASFGANALAAWNSAAQVTAGTMLATMGPGNDLLKTTMGFEINVGESFLEDVQNSGFFFFAGDTAGAAIAEGLTAAALTSGVLVEATAVVGMVKTATQTSVEITVKVIQQLLKNIVTVAGDVIGMGFHYQAMIDSFGNKDKTAGTEIDAQTVTANFGAVMGLLMLTLEKTSAIDQLSTALGDTGMGKDAGKMLTGYIVMIAMGLMKSRMAYGQYQDKQTFDALGQQATPSSLTSKYQGTKVPPQLLTAVDNTINKLADVFEKIAGSSVVNNNSVRFMGYCINLFMLNMQMTNVVESCDTSLGTATIQKGAGESSVAKDIYMAQESFYQSLITANNDTIQQISQVLVANLQQLMNYYTALNDSISKHSVT